jgi:hypothetical protein
MVPKTLPTIWHTYVKLVTKYQISGVPQGSVLEPLLFLLYINDITDNLGNLARLFADDTSLSNFCRNYDIMKSDINNDLSKLNE